MPMTLKLGMQHRVLKYYQVCLNDAPGLTFTCFTARSNLIPYAFIWEKVKIMDFSVTVVVYDIKVGRCCKLNEYMKLYEYQRSRSFFDLVPNHSDSMFLNFFSSITADFNILSTQVSDTGPMVSKCCDCGDMQPCLKLFKRTLYIEIGDR